MMKRFTLIGCLIASFSYLPWSGASETLMPAERHAVYRKYLPKIDDPKMKVIFADERLQLYTEAEMPKAYQDWESGLQGIHSPSYNKSMAKPFEPFGNGNREFPWHATAGIDLCANVQTVKFLWLPKDEAGKTLPVVWFNDRAGIAWIYPKGAVVGEVLIMTGPNNLNYTFEVRTRTRGRDRWTMDVYRPFPTAKHLTAAIKRLRPQFRQNQTLTALVEHLETPPVDQRLTLKNQHPTTIINETKRENVLPDIADDKLVVELLLETPFTSALGSAWGDEEESPSAPTTKAAFHIVPANYQAGFVATSRESCMRCHATTNRSVDEFQAGRDWYGRIRGSDGILSFHPFDGSCISSGGFNQGVSINDRLVKMGIVTKFDLGKHPTATYSRIPNLY